MYTPNSMAVKIVVATTFTFLLATVAVLYYQPAEVLLAPTVQAQHASQYCVACHTNADVITNLASVPDVAAGGG